MGCPLGVVQDGDVIFIGAEAGVLALRVDPEGLGRRRQAWKPRVTDYGSGALWKYAQIVGPAHQGAVTHPGMAGERHVYADI